MEINVNLHQRKAKYSPPMNPLAQLDYFLSFEGVKEIRSKFIPPPGAYQVEYNEDEDTYYFNIISVEAGEEKTAKLSFTYLLNTELTRLLKLVRQEIEYRIFNINSVVERDSLAATIISRLDQIITRWNRSPISVSYLETTETLEVFRNQVNKMLQPYAYSSGPTKENDINSQAALVLAPNYQLPSKNDKVKRLDIRQSALLFHYLRKHQAILDYSNSALASIVHALTGFSEHNIRTKEGFGAIGNIMSDKTKDGNFKNIPNYNLQTVRRLLIDIIADIDKEIATNSKKQKL